MSLDFIWKGIVVIQKNLVFCWNAIWDMIDSTKQTWVIPPQYIVYILSSYVGNPLPFWWDNPGM